MKKTDVLKQFCRFRVRTVFHRYWEILHGRVTLIALAVLLLTPPSAMSTYLHGWVDLSHGRVLGANALLSLFLTELLNFSILFVHSRKDTSVALEGFELSLPLGRKTRLAVDCLESALIQIPGIFLLLMACGDEFLTSGHGIRVTEFSLIFASFTVLMVLNHALSGFLKKGREFLDRHRLHVAPTKGLPQRLGRPSWIKLSILIRNRRRHFVLGAIFLTLLSLSGWSIALVNAPQQPKVFLFLLIFGLSFMILTPLNSALNEMDEGLQPLLFSLPVSKKENRTLNFFVLATAGLPFLFQASLWPLFARAGLACFLSSIFWMVLLMGLSLGVKQVSRKAYFPAFLVLTLLISWLAERLNHGSS